MSLKLRVFCDILYTNYELNGNLNRNNFKFIVIIVHKHSKSCGKRV